MMEYQLIPRACRSDIVGRHIREYGDHLNEEIMFFLLADGEFDERNNKRSPCALLRASCVFLRAICPLRDVSNDFDEQRIACANDTLHQRLEASTLTHPFSVSCVETQIDSKRRKLFGDDILWEIDLQRRYAVSTQRLEIRAGMRYRPPIA